MSGSDQRWTCQILTKIWLSVILWMPCGRQECLRKVRFSPNMEIVAWCPKCDVHRMSLWCPWTEKSVRKRRLIDVPIWHQADQNDVPDLTSTGRPPDIQTDGRFLRPWTKKSARKRRLIDVQFWRQAEQNLTSQNVPLMSGCYSLSNQFCT